MEQISPKYIINLQKKVKTNLQWEFSPSEIMAYLERWVIRHGAFSQNFWITKLDNGKIDLDKTIQDIDDETLLKIAIDLGIETPDFIPSIPTFKNEIKASYKTAGKIFEKACKKVEDDPENAISLANSALESIIREFLKDDRITERPKGNATLYELAQYFLKATKLFPIKEQPQEIRAMGNGLLNTCQAIENLRSRKTLAHGRTENELVIEESMYSKYVVNAAATIGLFFMELYRKNYPQLTFTEIGEMPF